VSLPHGTRPRPGSSRIRLPFFDLFRTKLRVADLFFPCRFFSGFPFSVYRIGCRHLIFFLSKLVISLFALSCPSPPLTSPWFWPHPLLLEEAVTCLHSDFSSFPHFSPWEVCFLDDPVLISREPWLWSGLPLDTMIAGFCSAVLPRDFFFVFFWFVFALFH